MRLYWSPDSANLVIRIALEMLDQPFEAERVDRGAGEHKRADYLARNPQGLLPVLEDGPLTLFETGAILWHVIERAGRFGPDGPDAEDPKARTEALKWMFWISNTLHADLRCAFYSHRYVPQDKIPIFRNGLRNRIAQHCDLMAAQLGKGGLLDAQPSIPDVYLCVCLRWAQIYPSTEHPMLGDLSAWPTIHALASRIEALPAACKAFEAEAINPACALTASRPPLLSSEEVTGRI